MNLREVHKRFSEDEQCLQYIQEMRWPDGVVRCPTCGNDKIVKVERAATSKNRRKWFFLCQEPTCHQQFSPTSGTIFHDTHLPLIVWFQAIALVLNAKKGISAKQLQRDLGIGGYKTAWYLYHRIREAMAEGAIPTMGGIVEIDETYIGGKVKGKGVAIAKAKKQVVVGVRERKGPLRLVHTPNAKGETLRTVIEATVDTANVDMFLTDTSSAAEIVLRKMGQSIKHHMVCHSKGEYVRDGIIHTNTIENAFSLLKRGIVRNYHKVSIKHLQRYLDEFTYRFNRREAQADPFIETVARLCGFKPLTYVSLTSEQKA
jgi:transposase-like protein